MTPIQLAFAHTPISCVLRTEEANNIFLSFCSTHSLCIFRHTFMRPIKRMDKISINRLFIQQQNENNSINDKFNILSICIIKFFYIYLVHTYHQSICSNNQMHSYQLQGHTVRYSSLDTIYYRQDHNVKGDNLK